MEVLMRKPTAFLACAVVFAAAPAFGQGADRIGIAAAAQNQVQSSLGAVQRSLKTGDGLSQNEQIRTGADSSAQLLFRDETTLSMGADSVLVLDKAVYDANKKSGEITVRAVSGAFRFVSGSSPSNNYKITTSSGTIGVRGTIVDVEIINQIVLGIVREGQGEFCASPRNCVIVNAGQFIVLSGGVATPPKPIGDHACGMTGLSGGNSKCGAKLIGSLVNVATGPGGNLGTDFQPGSFAGGPPPGVGANGIAGGPGGPGGSCSVLLPNGNCYPGVGSPGRGTPPPGLGK
jgi:hypothetical protein